MGGGMSMDCESSPLRTHIQDEFARLRDPQHDFLVLSEVIQLNPPKDIPIDFTHLGTLFVLDSNHNGLVTLKELFEFAQFYEKQRETLKPHEYCTQMQAYCTMRMRRAAVEAQCSSVIKNWLMRLLTNNQTAVTFEDLPEAEFISRDTCQILHQILRVQPLYGYDFQSFFDLLQRTGEEMNLMAIEDEKLDDVVPTVVLSILITKFVQGSMAMMGQFGF
eukprot:TRINITY_DN16678_c0_g1_i4.p1 TRINITY_DN16678_c0_g1~~TRINITY_DN16678_c0_g1_i4.p1  ORF type:complete len:219 (-),score=59.53 TRINITY_DN16678_c0_g1_i4:282-938(-)